VVVLPLRRVPGQALVVSLGVLSLSNVFVPLARDDAADPADVPEAAAATASWIDRWTIGLRGLSVRTVLVPGDRTAGDAVVPDGTLALQLERLEGSDTAHVPATVPFLAVRARVEALALRLTSDQYIFFVNGALDALELVRRLKRLLASLAARKRTGLAGGGSSSGSSGDAVTGKDRAALAALLEAVAPPAASHAAGSAPEVARPARRKVAVDADVAGLSVALLRQALPSQGELVDLLAPPWTEAEAAARNAGWQPLMQVAVGAVRATVAVGADDGLEVHSTLSSVVVSDQRSMYDWLDGKQGVPVPATLRDLVRIGRSVHAMRGAYAR
jgi:hypothetical protein